MIKVREMKRSGVHNSTGHTCDGCGKEATHQIVGQAIDGNTPTSGTLDLCERCGPRVERALTARREAKAV